jgi:hypothetical protein
LDSSDIAIRVSDGNGHKHAKLNPGSVSHTGYAETSPGGRITRPINSLAATFVKLSR